MEQWAFELVHPGVFWHPPAIEAADSLNDEIKVFGGCLTVRVNF
jgi:hypothetical protein